MKTGVLRSFKIFLAIQFIVVSAHAGPTGPQVPGTAPAGAAFQNETEDLVAELEKATEETAPREIKDPFHFRNQSLTITPLKAGESTRHSMSSLTLPDIAVQDFENKVQILADASASAIKIVYQDGRNSYTQTLTGFRPVAQARSRSLYFFVDASRQLFVLDMAVVKENLFRSFIPVFPVGALGEDIDLQDLKADFINRGLKPADVQMSAQDPLLPADLPENEIMQAENVLLYKESSSGVRTRVGVLDHSSLRNTLSFGEWFLFIQAMLVRPVNAEQVAAVASVPLSDEQSEQMETTAKDLDPQILDFLSTAPKNLIASLGFQAGQNKISAERVKDRFTVGEQRQQYLQFSEAAKKLIENPELFKKDVSEEAEKLGQIKLDEAKLKKAMESQNFQDVWRSLDQAERGAADTPYKQKRFRDILSVRSLKLMGTMVVGGASLAAISHYTGGAPAQWAMHTMNTTFDHAIKIFQDSQYRWTFLKYAMTTSMLVPTLYAAASLTAKNLKNVSWDFKQTWAVMGIRVSAYTDLPFYHYLAQLVRQPNFMRALRLGINPFKKIQTEDGAVRAGLNNPFQTGDEFKEDVEKRAALLDSEAKKEMRRQALSTSVAFAVAGQESGVDPASLMLVTEEGRVTKQGIEALYKISEDPVVQKKWQSYADEITYTLAQAGHGENPPAVSDASPELREKTYQIAREAAVRLKSEKKYETVLRKMRLKWRTVGSKTLSAIGNYALPQYQALKTEIPNKFVASQAWKEFVMDWMMSIWEVGLIGKRSDLATPEKLAARDHALAWANPQQLADLGNQAATFAAKVPGHLMLVYRSKQGSNDKAFDPIEEQSLIGAAQQDSFMSGVYTWMKDAANVPKARHAATILRTFTTRALTYQGSFVLMAASRLMTGAQTLANVLPGFLYYQLEQYPRASIFMTMANRSNQMYDQKFEQLAEVFADAKVRLGQGLRLDDHEMIRIGYQDLSDLYQGTKAEIPSEIANNLQNAEMVINTAVAGDFNKLGEMRERAQELLNFALETPPFATKKNEMVDFTAFFAALSARAILSVPAVIMSLDTKIPWTRKLTDASITAATIIGGMYVAEKVFIWVNNNRVQWTESLKRSLPFGNGAKAKGAVVLRCEGLFH